MNEELTNDLTRELNKSIQKAALDGTLTQKAVEQFNNILSENKVLKEANASQEKQLSNKRDENVKQKTALERATGELASYHQREGDLAERESQHEVLQMTVSYEKKRVEDHKEMVKLIFRNTTVRKEVMTPLRGSEGVDQYNTALASGYASKDTVEEEDV